jgi:hypothetical protein
MHKTGEYGKAQKALLKINFCHEDFQGRSVSSPCKTYPT